ncbi:hypothetical protein CRG49_005300 [Neisseria sp. N95_16]|nr:hypothetical protein CRG49_005300 [Neisseria sp. N95_16]PJO79031.1 hypothetical protein CWC45_01775 [Neisseria sp. N177_16]
MFLRKTHILLNISSTSCAFLHVFLMLLYFTAPIHLIYEVKILEKITIFIYLISTLMLIRRMREYIFKFYEEQADNKRINWKSLGLSYSILSLYAFFLLIMGTRKEIIYSGIILSASIIFFLIFHFSLILKSKELKNV